MQVHPSRLATLAASNPTHERHGSIRVVAFVGFHESDSLQLNLHIDCDSGVTQMLLGVSVNLGHHHVVWHGVTDVVWVAHTFGQFNFWMCDLVVVEMR